MDNDVKLENKYSEGVCGDGAAILCDGERLEISEIVRLLNENEMMKNALISIATPEECGVRVSDAIRTARRVVGWIAYGSRNES